MTALRKIRLGRADARVAKWADSVESVDLYLSAISVQELEIGVVLAERRDPAQGAVFRAWLNSHVLPAFAGRILPVDTAVAQRSTAQRGASYTRSAPCSGWPDRCNRTCAWHDRRNPQRCRF